MKQWNRVETGFMIAFIVWAAIGLVFTALKITPGTIDHGTLPQWLKSFVEACLGYGDPALILLAFANTHLHAARQWGAPLARRWGCIVVVAALMIETMGVATGFPFGSYLYTDRFGPLVGLVPFTIPLAWHVVVTNSLFLARWMVSLNERTLTALLTGLACALYDVVLEPFATQVKGYWFWRDGNIPPLQNYVAWFAVGFILTHLCAPKAITRFGNDLRPALILGATLLIFLAGRI